MVQAKKQIPSVFLEANINLERISLPIWSVPNKCSPPQGAYATGKTSASPCGAIKGAKNAAIR